MAYGTPLPSSGAMSASLINTDGLNKAASATLSLNASDARTLAQLTTTNTQISYRDFRNRSSRTVLSGYNIGYNAFNYIFEPSMLTGYQAGTTDVTLTILSGYTVGSTSTGSPALLIRNFSSGDKVTIVNNGKILGAGGRGGNAAITNTPATAGGAGGTALSTSCSIRIDNTNGIIGGGGGGGGGGFEDSIVDGWYGMPVYLPCGYVDSAIVGHYAYLPAGAGGGGAGSLAGAGGVNSSYSGRNGASGSATAGGAGGLGGNQNQTICAGGMGISTTVTYEKPVSKGYNSDIYSSGYGTTARPDLINNNGGSGGGLGQDGVEPLKYFNATILKGTGGSCTVGNSYITWIGYGLRYGALN